MIEKYIVFDIETTGLNPLYDSEITCICAEDSEGGTFVSSRRDNVELNIIVKFLTWLKEREDYIIVTQNGKQFDVPFIISRFIKHNKRFEDIKILLYMKHFDFQDIFVWRVSLENIARLYCIDTKNGNGKNAIILYKNNKFEDLEKYCLNDVIITKKCYLRYKNLQNAK